MKLLIVTQKVDKDDPILGFFHRWIEEFAKHCEGVIVICLEKGTHNLPENVKVLSLGKEKGVSRFTQIIRFYKYIFKFRKEYESVFVHMNPEYLVLVGVLWRMWRKDISLWYTHRSVDFKLRIAEKVTHRIFTVAKESFQLKSKKIQVVGHGIDTKKFICDVDLKNESLRLVSIGRITSIKRCEVLIQAAVTLREKLGRPFSISFIGEGISEEDKQYRDELNEMVNELGLEEYVFFEGTVLPENIVDIYCKADAAINMAPTGGVDKAVLEPMSCRRPVFASNKAFEEYFGEYVDTLLFSQGDSEQLAQKIMDYFNRNDQQEITHYLRQQIISKSNIEALIKKILSFH